MNILAIDPATKSGWAIGNDSGVWDCSVRRDESAGMRLIRFRSKLNEINKAYKIDLIVFEAARNAGVKMQGALVVQAGLQGILMAWCEDRGIQYRGYSPSEIKKHATGKGNANKAAMIQAAKDRWPGRKIADDNEADAMWLLDLAEKEYGK